MAAGKSAIEIWVPGPWAEASELAKAGVRHPDLKLLSRNKALADWMDVGSGGAFSPRELGRIREHRTIAALRLRDTGDRLARDLAGATRALRKAGGYGVRVARCGLAHPWDRWEAFLGEGGPGIYKALVVQVPDEARGRLETFGMNQFGLADASVEIDAADEDVAAWAAFAFNVYLREERPKLKDGNTFSFDDGAPQFTLAHEADDRYAVSDPYYNPQGLWVLTPVAD